MAQEQGLDDRIALTAEKIRAGKTSLGIEFGSTRIKAVLIDDTYTTIAAGVLYWNSSESFSCASEVLVFCQVRNGTSSSPASSNAR